MFSIGQKWRYKDPINSESYCMISLIESRGNDTIYHISVHDVLMFGELNDICHSPFSEDAFSNSVTTLLGEHQPISQDALDGIDTWREQKGGIWKISIGESVALIVETMSAG